MSNIINCILKTHRFPDKWKSSEVVPVAKTKNPTCLKDYRPISLLHHCSKVAEEAFLIEYKTQVINKLCKHQFAYQKGISTTDALIYSTEIWTKQLKQSNSTVNIIFKDFSKAFDMMQPARLLNALKNLQINENIIALAADFLTNRSQRVKVAQSTSNYMSSKVGVPQGTLCGPMFWLVFINIYHPAKCQLTMYADDITCFWPNNIH